MNGSSASAAEFALANDPENYVLRREGDRIVVSGSLIATTEFPCDSLLAALVACGERFAALARDVWAGDPDLPDLLNDLEQLAGTARAALAQAGVAA